MVSTANLVATRIEGFNRCMVAFVGRGHVRRGAAAAGGAATAGAAGTAAMLGSGESSDYGPYERSGRGSVSTEGELSNRFATYELNDPNPEQTAAMKEKIRLLEAEKAKVSLPALRANYVQHRLIVVSTMSVSWCRR